MNRAAPPLILTALIAAGSSCATIYAPALVAGQVAQVKILQSEPRVDFDGYRPKTFGVAVHDFANGCPLVESTRANKGFRGRIDASFDAATTVAVPAGHRLTFTSMWRVLEVPPGFLPLGFPEFCTSVVSFVPEPGRTYVIKYPEADPGKRACGATAEIEGRPQNHRGPALELIAYPHALRGAAAFQAGGLCALGAN
jgi:hypothetical protein